MNHFYRSLGLGLALTLALGLAGCGQQSAAETMDPTVTVETAAVKAGSLSIDGSYIGTVSAEGTARVIPMVSGMVEEIAVSVGDTVSEGQFLCRIDDESARLSLENARASYQSAQSAVQSAEKSYQSALAQYGGSPGSDSLPVIEEQVRMAEENYENTKALFDIGAAAQIEVEQAYQSMISAQAGLESARAGLRSAEAGVDQARAAISQAEVGIASAEYQLTLYNLTAPISGVVEAVNLTENNLASSGSVAFVISKGGNKAVTFYVTDEVQRQLKLGQRVTVNANGSDYPGTITEISGVVNQSTGLFQVKAVVNSTKNLPDGLTVELTTATQSQENVMLIPSDALYFDDGAPYVYLARDGTAVRTDVSIGVYTSDTIAVTAGLSPGEQVITTWSSGLKDGVPIRMAGEG